MKNYTMTVNNTGNDEQVVVQTVCREVLVGEDEGVANWPTTDWKFKTPGATDYTQKTAGTKQPFTRPLGSFFQPGDVICELATISGSTTFSIVEQ